MTQYDKLVHDTAEKMAIADGWIPEEVKDRAAIYEHFARIAVAMKAEGFDEGVESATLNTDRWGCPVKSEIEKDKTNLGLTKPTDNEQ